MIFQDPSQAKLLHDFCGKVLRDAGGALVAGVSLPCQTGQEEQKDSSKSSSWLCFIKQLPPPPAWNEDEILMG